MGGYLVNYYNPFGRQWQTYVEAEREPRARTFRTSTSSAFKGRTEARCLSGRSRISNRPPGPEFILHFNEYNCEQINITGAPGYGFGQVRAALEEVFRQAMPAGMGFSCSGLSFQEQHAAEGVPSRSPKHAEEAT
jgi:hydrophobic/amphiphilic exporter-1 (mainly G- bacteria), HAE1 family